MAAVTIDSLSKRYQQVVALDDISIGFQEGEFFALLGPSGSGKTTLLRTIAGFVIPDSGVIRFDNRPVENIPVHRRDIGMVFQNYALFPHMTVFDNIAFGLSVRAIGKRQQRERVGRMLELVRLAGYEQRKPRQLSGGQQQRVALARALITQPQVLLLDEPLGALDKRLRQTMQIELKQIQREVGLTTIFVTHDQEEALTLSDRIAIIDHGRLIQVGTPDDIYERPRSEFAAGFLGEANFFKGRVSAADRVEIAPGIELNTTDTLPSTGSPVTLVLRPEKILLVADGNDVPAGLSNRISGRIGQVVYSGNSNTYIIEADGMTLTAFEQNRNAQRLHTGSRVTLAWAAQHLVAVQPRS